MGPPTEENQENLLASRRDLGVCVFLQVFPRRHFWEEKAPQTKDKLQNMCKVHNPVTSSHPQGPNGAPQSFSLTRPSTRIPVNGVAALTSARGWRREATFRLLHTPHQPRCLKGGHERYNGIIKVVKGKQCQARPVLLDAHSVVLGGPGAAARPG